MSKEEEEAMLETGFRLEASLSPALTSSISESTHRHPAQTPMSHIFERHVPSFSHLSYASAILVSKRVSKEKSIFSQFSLKQIPPSNYMEQVGHINIYAKAICNLLGAT